MLKKYIAMCTFLFFLHFILCCTARAPSSAGNIQIASSSEFIAKKFPELELTTTAGEIHKGKLLNLIGRDVRFSPFPYWNVETIEIHLDDIHTIKLAKKRSKMGSGFIHGFGWTFIIVGIIGAATSEYDEDFETALAVSAATGAVVGLLGLVIGGVADAASKSEYKFYNMSDSEKTKAVLKIMGFRNAPKR